MNVVVLSSYEYGKKNLKCCFSNFSINRLTYCLLFSFNLITTVWLEFLIKIYASEYCKHVCYSFYNFS